MEACTVSRRDNKCWLDEHGALFDHPDVATAPSKDFFHIHVTPSQFILRVWKILPPHRGSCDPYEIKDTYDEFRDDDKFHSEVQRLAGTNMVDYLMRLCEGHIDYLARLPDKALKTIIFNLNLEDISHLSRVNKHFKELCNSCEVWRTIYERSSEAPITPELEMLAKDKGWKRLFFTNKLQLQVQLRRMMQNPEQMPPSGGYAFITHQEEEQQEMH
ncbi:F-box only protein 36-like [Argopecten irradians]|uniref:F-box only protein 36-like n=1 Tax=Argopecten irradians TaxID=31199 RepID=UPI003718D21A